MAFAQKLAILITVFNIAGFLFPLKISAQTVIYPDWSVNLQKEYEIPLIHLEKDQDDSIYIKKRKEVIKVSSYGIVEWTYEAGGGSYNYTIKGSPKATKDYVVFVEGESGANAVFLNKSTGQEVLRYELVKVHGHRFDSQYYSNPQPLITSGTYTFI